MRTANILAAKAVADAIRTSLGPRGMDKMIQSGNGDVVITNDGATILGQMQVLSQLYCSNACVAWYGDTGGFYKYTLPWSSGFSEHFYRGSRSAPALVFHFFVGPEAVRLPHPFYACADESESIPVLELLFSLSIILRSMERNRCFIPRLRCWWS